jgi:hypothetical protein
MASALVSDIFEDRLDDGRITLRFTPAKQVVRIGRQQNRLGRLLTLPSVLKFWVSHFRIIFSLWSDSCACVPSCSLTRKKPEVAHYADSTFTTSFVATLFTFIMTNER